MIRSYRNLPLRHKLTLLSLVTTTVAMLLACTGFAAYELLTFKQELVGDAATAAEMIGYNSASALSFSDARSAEQTLQGLSAQPDIIAACIYDKDGRVFATYPRTKPAADFGRRVPGAVDRFGSGELEIFRPIRVEGEEVGSIYIQSDFREIAARLRRLAWIIGAVLLAVIIVAYVLASRLQRVISAPVSALARIVSRVAEEKDYAIRAVKHGDDELGRLIDGFNEMLGQIQARDAALQRTQDDLEARVVRRTAELARAQARFKFIFDSVPVGIALVEEGDATQHLVNPAHERITGVTAADAGRPGAFQHASHPDDYRRQMELAQPFIRNEVDHYSAEKRYVHRDGTVVWVALASRKFIHAETGTRQAVTTLVDITERKDIEAKLAYERDQLRALLDSSPDVIYFKDTQSRFTLVSRSKVQSTLERVSDLRARRSACGLAADVPEADLLTGLTDFDTFNDADARVAYEDEQAIIRTGEPLIGKLERQTFLNGAVRWSLTSKMPWFDPAGKIIGTFGISKDISDLKTTEAKLEETHRQLLQTSRQAGMAEVATGVLHNVGNVLNSVNVSATLVADHLRHTKAANVAKVAVLFAQHKADLAGFLINDPRGQMIPGYLGTLGESLAAEHKVMIEELEHLRKNIEHIKDIVSMQQAYARTSGVTETVSVPDLIEDAIRINAGSLARHSVDTIREYQARPVITTDKHKVMQVLINLVGNAKYACDETGRSDKKITVRITSDAHAVRIAVSDNGVGIPAENLTRIFNHGFTTRKTGHGFGLHSGALAAKELGGSLHVESKGLGHGATFTLELPLLSQPPAAAAS